MHGEHAELFTYALHADQLKCLDSSGALKPLKLSHYSSATGIDREPYIALDFKIGDRSVRFCIESLLGHFCIQNRNVSWDGLSELHALLSGAGGFKVNENSLTKTTTADSIEKDLTELAQLLSTLPQQPS
jgi:hypothetical protein